MRTFKVIDGVSMEEYVKKVKLEDIKKYFKNIKAFKLV